MIKFAKDMTVTQRENVMGGTGRYSSQMLFSPEEVTKTRLFACNTMEPGASIGCHSHTGEGEAYLILSGEAVVEEDGVAYTLRPGDCEYCTDGHSHAIYNRSDAPMSFLAIIIL